MTRTGDFDGIITIEKPTGRISDGAGGWSNNGQFVAIYTDVWANVESESAQRKLQFAGVQFLEAYEIRFYIGNAENITRSCRILYRGKYLTIHSITNDSQADWEFVVVAYTDASQ